MTLPPPDAVPPVVHPYRPETTSPVVRGVLCRPEATSRPTHGLFSRVAAPAGRTFRTFSAVRPSGATERNERFVAIAYPAGGHRA